MLRSAATTVSFPGYLAVYPPKRTSNAADMHDEDGSAVDTGQGQDQQQQGVLLALKKGERVELLSAMPVQHFTKPPPRFTEASLVKELEELGIGRPSTYAAILKVLQVQTAEYHVESEFHGLPAHEQASADKAPALCLR